MPECPTCSRPYEPAEGPRCPNCQTFIGYPNVRRANLPEQVAALDARYEAARADAAVRGAGATLAAFESALSASQAVVNVGLPFLLALMTSEQPYATYREQVAAGTRAPAKGDWDRERAAVDAFLFGTYDKDIRYAALTLSSTGLTSYGEFSLILVERQIAERASLLDENAFDFVARHRLVVRDPIPLGYLASWPNRAKLAVAKLAGEVEETTSVSDFARLLLNGAGDRATDRFVEVHIFGGFGRYAVASVHGSSVGLSKRERAKLMAVKDFLASTGGTWIES